MEAGRNASTGGRDSQGIGSVSGQNLDGLNSQVTPQESGDYDAALDPESMLLSKEQASEVVPLAQDYRANGQDVRLSHEEIPVPVHHGKVKSKKRSAASFVADWLMWIVLVAATAGLELVPPRAIYIPYEDLPRYSFPFQGHDTVPTWTVPLYAIVGPYAVMAPLTIMRHQRWGPGALPYPSLAGELSRLATTILTVEFATGLTTNAVKLMVGRPRPNFAERCWPNGVIEFKTQHPAGLDPILKGGVPKCSGKPADVKEGMKSFPSGHTSWSAAGLSFFSWWLRDYLRPLKPGKKGHAWHAVAAYWPMFGAVLVGVSRYTDYMHHWQDILVGYLLGTGISWIMYHLRWPSGWNQALPVVD